jgi:methionyl-tRNA synthetase
MIHRYYDGHAPLATAGAPDNAALDATIGNAPRLIAEALEDFDFRRATEAVWRIADGANRYVNHTRPWDLAKVGDRAELAAVLSALLRACQAIAEHLAPFLPDAATRITRQCTTDATGLLPAPAPILPRIAEPVLAERPAARRGIQVN